MTEKDRSAAAPPPKTEALKGCRDTEVPDIRSQYAQPADLGQARQQAKRRKKRADFAYGPRRANPLYAALDLGTNNCRLLIVRPHQNGYRVIDGFTRIVRLGEGLSSTGLLDESAMQRTFEALRQCRNKLAQHSLTSSRLIATEACRIAANAPQFLTRIKSELGLDLEIIDRQTEAQLAVNACSDLVESEADGALLFDIGGGSSELAWLDFRGGRPRRNSKMSASIRSWQSLPVGVVTIAEKFGGVEVSAQSFEDMVEYVSSYLRHFRGRNKLKQMIADHPMHLIGTSGTVTTLAGLHLGLERYERSKVDGLWMHAEQVTDTMRVLLKMPYQRRVANPCIGRDRADLVIPGCAIFEAIRREWPASRVRVADRGLREGILISLIDADHNSLSRQRRNRHDNSSKKARVNG
ncbi:Exopolyphosphatase [hydrothermal vent metagenome]|uniref:Exopolyphosphatase n=1 Tax=hydrothermal vent metagenome TaxID=652676 RepID=A0A3B0U6S4_9ZZZZ